jgi:hypothetical protein
VARRAALRDYIEANDKQFSREALATAALDAGYVQAEVDSAFVVSSRWNGLTSGMFLVGIGFLACWIVTTSIVGSSAFTREAFGWLPWGVLGLSILAAVLVRDSHPNVAYGIGCGVLGAILVLLPFFVIGTTFRIIEWPT